MASRESNKFDTCIHQKGNIELVKLALDKITKYPLTKEKITIS
jgi:hypothetical protein